MMFRQLSPWLAVAALGAVLFGCTGGTAIVGGYANGGTMDAAVDVQCAAAQIRCGAA